VKKYAIADSGAMSHCLTKQAYVKSKHPATAPISVKLPNNHYVYSTHTCEIPIPELPLEAKQGHITPRLSNHSLICIFQLCDAECYVLFEKTNCTVNYKGQTILKGAKCPNTRLWFLSIARNNILLKNISTTKQKNNVYDIESMEKSAKYLHQCIFFPPTSTLIKAIENDQLLTFPGLTSKLILKHLSPSMALPKEKLHPNKKHLQLTKIENFQENESDIIPIHEANAAQELFCFVALADMNTGTIYSDLTGHFLV